MVINNQSAAKPLALFLKYLTDRLEVYHEEKSKIVSNKGTPPLCIGLIPTGGQVLPDPSQEGFVAKYKNAQKKATNNIISDTINNLKPSFKPFRTLALCLPCTLASTRMV
jgi:hypothetical protein